MSTVACCFLLTVWASSALGLTTLPRLLERHIRVDGSRAAELAGGRLKLQWVDQPLNHFGPEGDRWNQRVFICDKYWEAGGPIFFYAGNEGPVELYVNNTGLMWEQAEAHKALLVFAEHRYYGESQPFGPDSWRTGPRYLSTAQALGDYASLIWRLKTQRPGAKRSAVIVFGGSYGGELAVWLRVKYPHLVAGAIAASAPIAGFPGVDGFNPSAFWEVVTRDASPAAGAAALCVNNTRTAFQVLLAAAGSHQSRATVSRLLRLCKPLSASDVVTAAYWIQGAFDAFAMGNYPYPSSYISGDPEHPLPAWPMRGACTYMTKTLHMYQSDLMEGLANAAGLMYNASGQIKCFDLDVQGPAAGNTGPWDYQVCTEQMAQEQPYFPSNGVTDMFWNQGPYNDTAIAEHCKAAWGVTPSPYWAAIQYGGADVLSQTSNIVLSNGLLDPWSVFGVLHDVSDTVVAVIIPEGAHHVDLMFSNPADTPAIKAARKVEMNHVRRWIKDHEEKHKRRGQRKSSKDAVRAHLHGSSGDQQAATH